MSFLTRFLTRAVLLGGLLLVSLAAQPAAARFNDTTPLEWSQRLAESEMARRGDRQFFGGSNPQARLDYTAALFGTTVMPAVGSPAGPPVAAGM